MALTKPLTFLTNCSEAARISSSVTGGSKLNKVLMFLHIGVTSILSADLASRSAEVLCLDVFGGIIGVNEARMFKRYGRETLPAVRCAASAVGLGMGSAILCSRLRSVW